MIETAGRFHAIDTDHIVAGANEIFDDEQNQKQSDINAEVKEALGEGGSVNERIAHAVSVEAARAEEAEGTLGGRIETLEEAVGSGGSVDDRIAEEAAKHYLKTETYNKTETYSKPELNNLITTPNQDYVTVTATDQTTAATDVLPATGEADTIYRVGNWDGSQYDESVYSEYAWDGSGYIHLSTKTQIGEVFDISAYNSNTPYVDLAAALGTNGANIPQSLRKGGMSVKFIQGSTQSSDNKYVQYRLMADDWSTNTEDWAIADEGVYVENSEFVYVYTDGEDKILWAIQKDGNIYFGAGCPQQVKDYIEEKISSLLDEYEDIVAFLTDYLGSDTTLKVLIDGINERIPALVENPDFIDVTTDGEDKILEGITSEGVKQIFLPIETPSLNIEHADDNPEWLEVTTDSEDKILEGRTKDGTKVEYNDVLYPNGIPSGVKDYIDAAIPESKDVIENQWKGKNVVVYGDSITAQGNGDSPTTFSYMFWAYRMFEFANMYQRGIGGQTYIWNNLGWYTEPNTNGRYLNRYKFDSQGQETNVVVSPETITQEDINLIESALGKQIEVHYGAFCSWDRITSMIPSSIRETIDLVIICGGVNDFFQYTLQESFAEPIWIPNDDTDPTWSADNTFYKGGDYDITTFAGGIASTIMKMQVWCPNAVVILATPFPCFNMETCQQAKKDIDFRKASEMEMAIAHYVGAEVIDANGRCGINGVNFPDLVMDGVHPNNDGRKLFGRVFKNELIHIGTKI